MSRVWKENIFKSQFVPRLWLSSTRTINKKNKVGKTCDSCGGEIKDWSGELRCWTCGNLYDSAGNLLERANKQKDEVQVKHRGTNLIKCQDCGYQISDYATACPNCGRRRKGKFSRDQDKGFGEVLVWIGLTALIIYGLESCGYF